MNRIAELRRIVGMSQRELAEALATSPQQIHRLETGQRRLTQDWLVRIASRLECEPAALLPGELAPTTLEGRILARRLDRIDARLTRIERLLQYHYPVSYRRPPRSRAG